MMHEIKEVAYYVTCDVCNNRRGPKAGTQSDAVAAAREEGWRRWTVKNGLSWEFCPECWKTDAKQYL